SLSSQVLLAPMAGVSDLPMRKLCLAQGAGLAFGEMLISDTRHWGSRKSAARLQVEASTAPIAMQIAGSAPKQMAEAAKACVDAGAQIVDINMGCPAKKVCNRAAGSALLRDETLVGQILDAVVAAVDTPVTLKIRTGWCPQSRNAVAVAKIAEAAGVAALTVHGRSRACRFSGPVEYATISEVVAAVTIPVIANGDITRAAQAQAVLAATGAAGVMVGRAAQGNPWIFREINDYLQGTQSPRAPSQEEILTTVLHHLEGIYALYGQEAGVRIARKHFAWYLAALSPLGAVFSPEGSAELRRQFNQVQSTQEQQQLARTLFGRIKPLEDQAA
ncbi:MAG TPA: tRNA dihydrouridine synthase DusB, partial [Cellvibrionaceae bacterium]|nr:tRNA dihydrouridine synthase DusB [Cellvibrionaceae bacterium]